MVRYLNRSIAASLALAEIANRGLFSPEPIGEPEKPETGVMTCNVDPATVPQKRCLSNIERKNRRRVYEAIKASGMEGIEWSDRPDDRMPESMAGGYGSVWLTWTGDTPPDTSAFWRAYGI
jgi:hypothetical protein